MAGRVRERGVQSCERTDRGTTVVDFDNIAYASSRDAACRVSTGRRISDYHNLARHLRKNVRCMGQQRASGPRKLAFVAAHARTAPACKHKASDFLSKHAASLSVD